MSPSVFQRLVNLLKPRGLKSSRSRFGTKTVKDRDAGTRLATRGGPGRVWVRFGTGWGRVGLGTGRGRVESGTGRGGRRCVPVLGGRGCDNGPQGLCPTESPSILYETRGVHVDLRNNSTNSKLNSSPHWWVDRDTAVTRFKGGKDKD